MLISENKEILPACFTILTEKRKIDNKHIKNYNSICYNDQELTPHVLVIAK